MVRVREQERIEKENHKFAQRLYESKGVIEKKVFDEDFTIQNKYRMNITKVKPCKPKFFGDISLMSQTNRLPPLNRN